MQSIFLDIEIICIYNVLNLIIHTYTGISIAHIFANYDFSPN